MTVKLKQVHSLHKIFADEPFDARACNAGHCLRGEVYSFQIAYTAEQPWTAAHTVQVQASKNVKLDLRRVELVPVEYTGERHDDAVLRTGPGLYPDLLQPLQEPVRLIHGQWRSIWVTVRVPEHIKAGPCIIESEWRSTGSDQNVQKTSFRLEILDAVLPAARLDHTEWFHADCISTYYRVKPWSPRHWELLKAYFQNCASHGQNMLLTPIFTPPLDTAVGGERPTVQLIDIKQQGQRYSFSFTRLKKWIRLARAAGIEKFEMAHLFTQWGASAAPKIIVNGKVKFGWHTDAHGKAYRTFLKALLAALIRFIDKEGLRQRVVFHVSDEPNKNNMDSYAKAAAFVRPLLKGFKVIDALSSFDFYQHGLVEHPVPSNNHIEDFAAAEIPDLWTYYCTSQWNQVPNRFMHMPSSRNRIMGFLLFKYKLSGFLHWGYNFWYTQHSIRPVDPYRETDAGRAFQSGDAFLVYPGPDGPVDSIRHEVFFEAQQDLRVCQALADRIGYERVLKVLERGLSEPLSMTTYPMDPEWLMSRRKTLNVMLARLS